jgi:hypothetical protein
MLGVILLPSVVFSRWALSYLAFVMLSTLVGLAGQLQLDLLSAKQKNDGGCARTPKPASVRPHNPHILFYYGAGYAPRGPNVILAGLVQQGYGVDLQDQLKVQVWAG